MVQRDVRMVRQYNGTTVQWYDGTTVRRYNGTTVQRYNGTTVQRYNGTTVQRYDGTTVRRYNGTMVQRYNGVTWQYDFSELLVPLVLILRRIMIKKNSGYISEIQNIFVLRKIFL